MAKKKVSKVKQSKKKVFFIQAIIIVSLALSIVFSSIFIFLVVGMLPSVVAWVADKTKGKLRTMGVSALNFAGCVPFLIEIGKAGFSLDTALNLMMEPNTIIVVYTAAAMGYIIDWGMTGVVSSIMLQNSTARIKDIEKRQGEFVKRWGSEVTGTIGADKDGSLIE